MRQSARQQKCYSGGYYYNAQNCQEVAPEAFVDRGWGARTTRSAREARQLLERQVAHLPRGLGRRGAVQRPRQQVQCQVQEDGPQRQDEGGSTSYSTNWNVPPGPRPAGADSNTNVNLCPAGQVATRLLPYNTGCRRRPARPAVADMARNVE